jgi:hypothetical protein
MTDRLNVLKQCFPFPEGGKPNEKVQGDAAISILMVVEELERDAVVAIEALLKEWSYITQ